MTKQPRNPATQPPVPPCLNEQTDPEAEELWQQLQAAWDEHSRHIDEIVAHSGKTLLRINTKVLRATKRRILMVNITLAFFCTVVAVLAVLAVLRRPDTTLQTLYCIAAVVAIAVVCILSIDSLPSKGNFRPLVALPSSGGEATPHSNGTSPLIDAMTTQHRYSVLHPSSLKSFVTILTATTVLAFAACTPADNKCKTTSANTAKRMETIAIIDTVTARNTQP